MPGRRLHFRMHLLVDHLGPAGRRVAERLVVLSVIALGGVLVVGSIAIAPIAHRQVTDALEVPQFWFFGALPLGGALMIVFALPHLWREDPPW